MLSGSKSAPSSLRSNALSEKVVELEMVALGTAMELVVHQLMALENLDTVAVATKPAAVGHQTPVKGSPLMAMEATDTVIHHTMALDTLATLKMPADMLTTVMGRVDVAASVTVVRQALEGAIPVRWVVTGHLFSRTMVIEARPHSIRAGGTQEVSAVGMRKTNSLFRGRVGTELNTRTVQSCKQPALLHHFRSS